MTTYTLRSANPAKTRCDAVVVGVVQAGKGRRGSPPGGEDVATAYGRKLRPLLSSLGVTGKAGEVAQGARPAGTLSSPLLVLVGLGKDGRTTVVAVRRAAGAAARAVTNAASVAIALPADSPELVRAVTEGFAARRLHVHDVQEERRARTRRARAPARSSCCSRVGAARRTFVAAFEEAQRRRPRPSPPPATGSTRRPATCTPPAFADAVAAAAKELEGPRRPKVVDHGPDEKELAELGCGGILGVGGGLVRPAAAGRADLLPAATPSPTWRWSARASPSTPAA